MLLHLSCDLEDLGKDGTVGGMEASFLVRFLGGSELRGAWPNFFPSLLSGGGAQLN